MVSMVISPRIKGKSKRPQSAMIRRSKGLIIKKPVNRKNVLNNDLMEFDKESLEKETPIEESRNVI